MAATTRSARAARRSWWADGLEAAVWFAAATGIAFMFSSNALATDRLIDYVYAAGRGLGIVAAVLMMAQVLLASRAPWFERAIGHDRAMAKHSRLGKWAIITMLAHWSIITVVTANYEGHGILQVSLDWGKIGWWMLLVQIAIALFTIVLATSLVAVRRRWKYETWHGVHLVVYVAVAFAVPHQFLEGSTFRDGTTAVAWWFWLALYVISFGSFIGYRLVRPLVRYARYRVAVESVTTLPDGSTSVVFAGRGLERLRAKPGQFFLWRFLQGGHAFQAHPYSLSAAPAGTLRITVKPSGDGSSAVADLRPGTRVIVEGPLGIFTDDARRGQEVLLVGAGIGVTPIRSILESVDPGDDVTVVLRARSKDEAPLFDEVTELAREKQANLHVMIGSRGESWGTVESPAAVSALVTDPRVTDVFICGPLAWARQVEEDARAAGVPADNIHREEFAW